MEKTMVLSRAGMEIPCKLYIPEYGNVSRCVIAVHGFGGNRNSPAVAAVADEMAFYNTATIIFDLPAHGDNPMGAWDLTLENCRNTLLAVAQYAQSLWPEAEFCLMGTSFGGYVALLAMDDLKELLGRIKVVLRSPAVRMHKTFLAVARIDEEEYLKRGRIVCGYDRKMDIPYRFYEELQVNNACANYEMPMMIIQGDRDELVLPEDVEFFRLLNDQAKLVIIPECDHRYLHEGQLDMIVDLARDWFLCEDVLLCEWR